MTKTNKNFRNNLMTPDKDTPWPTLKWPIILMIIIIRSIINNFFSFGKFNKILEMKK